MRIPTVEKCCCGCNLRLGSAIIGLLFFFSALINIISFSISADNEDDNQAMYILNAIIAAVMLLSTILLLFGVHKEREGLLRPWLMLYGALAVLSVILLFVSAIVGFATGLAGAGAALLAVALVYILIYGYCLVVVYSYYLSLSGVQPGTV